MKQPDVIVSTVLILLFSSFTGTAQNVGISADGSLPNNNAILDIKASDKGLLIPRTSTVSRLLIPNTKGLMLYTTSYLPRDPRLMPGLYIISVTGHEFSQSFRVQYR